jgi:membrane-bound serine protease (ClpP class)
MRRLVAIPLVVAAAILLPATVWAQTSPTPSEPTLAGVDVLKVGGVIDAAVQGYLEAELAHAESRGSVVVLQIDSPGGYGDRAAEVARTVAGLRVPVVAWVGPSGARAEGGALFLVYSASVQAMAPGAGMGPGPPFDLSVSAEGEDPGLSASAIRRLEELGRTRDIGTDAIAGVVAEATPAGPALQSGAVSLVSGTVPELLTLLDGRIVPTAEGRVRVSFREPGTQGAPTQVRFREPGPIRRILHAGSAPTAVYVLIVLGLWGIAFELTQPAFGMAGVAGLLALAFAAYGLTAVPVGWLGMALLLGGSGLQAVDVIIRRLGPLTFTGGALFGVGSWLAWRGVSPAVDVPTWLIALATAGTFLFFGFGMTVALRARERVRNAQVGLVGLVGEVRADLNPEGGSVAGPIHRRSPAQGDHGSCPGHRWPHPGGGTGGSGATRGGG